MENVVDVHEKPKKTKSGKIVNIISNCIFVPVMLILVVYFVYALSVMQKNGVPSFFGQAYARVLSKSMTASGFEKGDIVMLEKLEISEIEVGDVIAFYYCTYSEPTLFGSKENAKEVKSGEKTFKTMIYFHKVYDIKYDTLGNTWFYTYGTSNVRNSSADPNDIPARYSVDAPTRGDHVVGRYKESWIPTVLEFISSPMGMIVLVIVPCAVLLFTLLLNIIEIIDQMQREKKQKLALSEGDVQERELDVTTIIEEHEELDNDDR